MKELRGVITREELEAYGGAEIAMLDAGNDATDSTHELSGSGTYTWSFTYDDTNGFTGIGWVAMQFDFSTITDSSERDAEIEKYKVSIAQDLGTTYIYLHAGCASWDEQ